MNPIRVLTFNVSHGTCHAIWSPSGKLVVIDLGASDDFEPLTWLKKKGHKTIDLLIISHPHDDHIRGFRHIAGLEIKVLHRPSSIPAHLTAELHPELKTAWDTHHARYTAPVLEINKFYDSGAIAFDGLSIEFFGGVSDSSNLNNYSVVTVLKYATLKIVFPGDIENAGWTTLLKNNAFTTAIKGTDILIASHHGREAGWCAELFDHMSPALVVVSDGAATDTSVVSKYIDKARGATVSTRETKESKTRYVVSTRDNGHIEVNGFIENGATKYKVLVDTH